MRADLTEPGNSKRRWPHRRRSFAPRQRLLAGQLVTLLQQLFDIAAGGSRLVIADQHSATGEKGGYATRLLTEDGGHGHIALNISALLAKLMCMHLEPDIFFFQRRHKRARPNAVRALFRPKEVQVHADGTICVGGDPRRFAAIHCPMPGHNQQHGHDEHRQLGEDVGPQTQTRVPACR